MADEKLMLALLQQMDRKLDEHFERFQEHVKDDKVMMDHLRIMDKEITFAKGVTYAVNAMTASVMAFLGLNKP